MIEQPEHMMVDGVRAYAKLNGGVLACMIRAKGKATFDAMALEAELKVYTNPAQPAVIDEDGTVITPAVRASGPLIPAPGVTITEIGNMVLTPAVLDDDGKEVTPAVTDKRYHVNFWLAPAVVARGQWKAWVIGWEKGAKTDKKNRVEESVSMRGIELIDPATIATPANVLL